MSITFRIATAANDQLRPVATINGRQLAAFRTLLQEDSVRTGTVLLAPEAAKDAYLSCHFETRVYPITFAAASRVFEFEANVFSVVERALCC